MSITKDILRGNHLLAACLRATLFILAQGAFAQTAYYVTPTGADPYDGASWASAFSNVQAAADEATNAGDTIYLQWGVYSNASQIEIANAPGLTIRGGCVGNGTNDYSGTNSTLTRTNGALMRIVYATNSTLDLSGLTVSGGYQTNNAIHGMGLYLSNCPSVTLSNCAVLNNLIAFNPGTAYGAGIYFKGGALTLVSCLLTNNEVRGTFNCTAMYGGGLFFSGANLVLRDTTNIRNIARTSAGSGGAGQCYGGGVYATNVSESILLTRCLFERCYVEAGAGNGYGGAVHWLGGSGTVENCVFTGNYASVIGNGIAGGGALYLSGITGLTVRGNALLQNWAYDNVTCYGSAAYLSGTDCEMDSNRFDNAGLSGYAEMIRAGGFLRMRHCAIERSTHDGLVFSGASLGVTNCLFAACGNNGLTLAGGTATVVNCTLADNVGWGINRTGGTGTVLNCIAWGNGAGGITNTTSLNVAYSCSQDVPYGSSNLTDNPLFYYTYYLSAAGLTGQASNSPCIDAGANTADFWGLTNRTTRTDGSNDTGIVDLGYHYAGGADPGIISNGTLYVDAVGGSDANSGLSAGAALKTMTNALARVIRDGTIIVAAGTNNAASGETFPLTVAQPNLRVVGAARDVTVFDAGSAGRVFYIVNMGVVRLENLTVRNGYLGTAANGAGLYLSGNRSVTFSNCAILNNLIAFDPGTACGAGLYCSPGELTLVDCLISSNEVRNTLNSTAMDGGGIFFSGASLTLRNVSNIANAARTTSGGGGSGDCYGGGVYASVSSSVLLTNCLFARCYAECGGNNAYGGAVYWTGGSGTVADCVFTANYCNVQGNGTGAGGALYLSLVAPLAMRANTFLRNFAYDDVNRYGSAAYLTGTDCDMDSNRFDNVGLVGYAEMVRAGGSLRMRHCTIERSTDDGLYFSGSALGVTNCLFAACGGDGLTLAGGTATVVNCTLADNSGWGINRTGGTGTVLNCIAWGNGVGGITNNSSLAVSYSCSQDSPYGSSNLLSDPLFCYAYYLSVAGLPGQASNSPCIDAGSGTADAFGLTNRTTRTDGSNDTGIVDLGYHYTNGVDSSVLSNSLLYVNAVSGSDANSGLSAGSALKTMTNALARVLRDGTIMVAAGTNNAASGETFPLSVAQPNLRIVGAGRDLTIFDATASGRVFYAVNKGALRFENLTIRNGYFGSADYGAGLYLSGNASVTFSNCAVLNNTINYNSGSGYGAGMYVTLGTLTLVDCLLTNNQNRGTFNVGNIHGGGIYFSGASLLMRRATFLANAARNSHPYASGPCYGGGLYGSATVSAQVFDSLFDGNYAGSGSAIAMGGAIYLSAVAADIATCVFTNNYASAKGSSAVYGGALNVASASPLNLVSNEFRRNYLQTPNATRRGGAIYAGGGTVNMLLCNVCNNYASSTDARGDIYLNAGTLTMTNCLVAANQGSGLVVAGGDAIVANCTFADNTEFGIINAGTLTARNSIAWGNASGGIAIYGSSTLTYTDSQEPLAGLGNLSQDPLFVNPVGGDYHEKSTAGAYFNGLWNVFAQMSPCIDAGDPGSSFSQEPKPNGKRVNLGAYGNTPQASLSSSRGTVITMW